MADNPISLCLSGGGLRATLFHLGVVRALREHRMDDGTRLIDRIGHVFSVSGGSILAAHMLLRWDLYTGDDTEFDKARRQVFELAQRNVRDRVLRRAILSALPLRLCNLLSESAIVSVMPLWLRNLVVGSAISGRTYWLMREYDHLLGNTRIDAAIETNLGKPTFHILATNFMTGELCSFSGNNFEVEHHESGNLTTPCGHLTLSRAVAASSAFPPMFPPMLLDDKLLARPRDNAFLLPLQLSDGGVYDNLGIEKFRRMLKRSPSMKGTLIVSNAGSPFRSEASKKFSGMLSRNIRASDILMRRIGRADENGMADSDIVIRLTDAVPDGVLDPAVQQTLRLVRTDLDRFPPDLADLLLEHGADAAKQRFQAKGWESVNQRPETANTPVVRERQKEIASRAEARSFTSLLFDFKDLGPLLAIWMLASSLVFATIFMGYSYREAKRSEQKAELQAKEAKLRAQAEKLQALAEAIKPLSEVTRELREGNVDRARKLAFDGISELQSEQEKNEKSLSPVTVPSNTAGAISVGTAKATYPLRIYTQFSGDLTRKQIEELNASLKSNGWKMQGKSGERIATAGGLNEVRYAGNNLAAAQQLADAINAAGITSSEVTPRLVPIVGDRNLEVWISK